MFGTRDLFSKSEKINEIADRRLEFYTNQLLNLTSTNSTIKLASEDNNLKKAYEEFLKNTLQDSKIFFLQRLYQQAKQLSQIIVYIWRWADEDGQPQQEVAKQLKIYFDRPTEDNSRVGGNLKQLLAADSMEDSPEANLLREVFPDYDSNENLIFPMFDSFELGEEDNSLGYLFEVNVNSFHGVLEDVERNAPDIYKFVIPYPPRPQIGETNVTSDELERWIENREENKFFADNPYIPTTCS